MKKNIFFCLLFLGALASCEQEEFTGTGLEALSEFTLNPLSESTIELSSVNPKAELVITWNEAKSGLNSDVIYTWNAFEEGTSSSEVLLSLQSDNSGSDNQLTLTQEALDAALEDLGLGTGESITLNWFVIATNGDVTKESETSTVTISRFVDEIATFDLLSPSDGTQLDLDIDNPSTQVVITWDSTYSGFENTISYQWIADTLGGDFTNPLLTLDSDNSGSDNQITLTHQDLEDFMESEGVEEAGYMSLSWKVVASGGDLSLQSESTFAISLRRFNPVASKFLVGAATPGGWGWDNPSEIVETSEGIFEGTLTFSNETFRVFEVKDDWGSGRNFPYYESEGYIIDSRFENAGDGDQNFRYTGTPGEYTFTLNTVDKTIRLTVGESKYMVGAATPGGWGWDNPTEMFQIETGVWQSTLVFTNDTFRFFDVKDDWGSGTNFPFYENDGYTIDANFENAADGDQNFRFIGTTGSYTITLDTVNKNITLN